MKGAQQTLLLLLVLLIAASVGYDRFDKWRLGRKAVQADNRAIVLDNTSAGIEDGVEIDNQQQAYARGLADARQVYQQQTNEDARHEPETAIRDNGAIPDSRLRAFQQRRLSRERLGCTDRECEEGR